MARVENLLGALSLTVADQLREVGAGKGMSASEQASLTTLLAHPDRRVSWLGDVLGLTSSGVTRLVDRLVDRGWVTRSPGSDARQRRLRLTAAGTKRARAFLRERDDVCADVLEPLSGAERAALERILGRLVGELHGEQVPALRTCRLCDVDVCNSAGQECPLHHTVTADA
jgi:DNA-binding MarR family transcriptional regulator